MKWAYPRKSTEEHHSVGNMWMQMSKKKSSFCYMMDGKDVLQLPLYPPSHGTFRPFQMYCLVFGLLLVSRLLQYFKPQKFDTYSHVKQMFVPIFPMNGESREQMVLSKTPIKTMHESVLQLEVFFGCECECQSQTLQTRKFSNKLKGRSSILIQLYSCDGGTSCSTPQCDKKTMDQVVNH